MMRPDPPSLPAIPSRLADLDAWRARHGFSREAARRRYAQAAIAAGIALTPALRQSLVFKGGNALDFALSVNRSTIDLDFSFDHTSESMVAIPEEIERYLSAGCEQAALRQEMSLAVHRVRQHPPGPDRTFVTFTSRIGYALPDEVALRERMAQGRPSPNIVPVEISINEPICAESTFSPGAGLPSLRISSIEDIVAEKLRALIQQVHRNRQRPQDLLDIAVILQGTPLDPATIASFLLTKAAARDVPVSRTAFCDPELARRARIGYAELATTTRVLFIPFEQALADVLAFVDGLPIPEQQ